MTLAKRAAPSFPSFGIFPPNQTSLHLPSHIHVFPPSLYTLNARGGRFRDLAMEDLSSVKLQIFAEENIANFAEMLKVPKENVRIISRTEYKANTEE